MKHRTQLHLDDAQYRWLKRRAARTGSIAGVVRELIDAARRSEQPPADDAFLDYLLAAEPSEGSRRTSVTTLDDDVYGR
ncbi:MAG TPA: hypothetical protein VG126_10095 [Thermoleophilaceae bacterium]|nr:hypothetical protein [Thermoleophilaceae bacterium]